MECPPPRPLQPSDERKNEKSKEGCAASGGRARASTTRAAASAAAGPRPRVRSPRRGGSGSFSCSPSRSRHFSSPFLLLPGIGGRARGLRGDATPRGGARVRRRACVEFLDFWIFFGKTRRMRKTIDGERRRESIGIFCGRFSAPFPRSLTFPRASRSRSPRSCLAAARPGKPFFSGAPSLSFALERELARKRKK